MRLAPVISLCLALLFLPLYAQASAAPLSPQLVAGESAVQGNPPFRLPFADPPGPSTWLPGQLYGNTTGAYLQRDTTYRLGQGIHFGIDLSARCGTPVVAIGDGVVDAVDGPYGSAPHNVMINHPNGYSSLYGHLRERSHLQPGQQVKTGQVIGMSGDPFETCRSAPHLHLEIRDRSHLKTFNPIPLIAADWDSILLYGTDGAGFERDLTQPRRWQFIDDQPGITFGGALLNNYSQPWPRDYRR
jgi:murein DD-endopeptidase MepM/ murein hydrolase activator NlpD